MAHVLPDLLRPGLRVVFCGTAAGAVSKAKGAYYAGPGNRFWHILAATRLTPCQLRPDQFGELLEFGIGLTDVAKMVSGADADLPAHAFDPVRLTEVMREVQPVFLAFNGKKAAAMALGRPSRQLAYGAASDVLDLPPVVVLPSTSGAASGFWDPAPWFALAARIGAHRH